MTEIRKRFENARQRLRAASSEFRHGTRLHFFDEPFAFDPD
jgi:hypothetical protein